MGNKILESEASCRQKAHGRLRSPSHGYVPMHTVISTSDPSVNYIYNRKKGNVK